MKPLTERQQEILNFIEGFVAEHAYPPTMREIADHFGISTKGAYDHVTALKRKGAVRAADNRSRSLEVLTRHAPREDVVDLPLLGNVAAGKPIFADERFEETVPVPVAITRERRCFALRVRGDSMTGAGILDGDLAVVESREVAVDGDIVVALLEDSVTLKRFYKEKGRVKLAAENPAFSPIYTQDVRILGKLCGIVRSY